MEVEGTSNVPQFLSYSVLNEAYCLLVNEMSIKKRKRFLPI